MLEPGQNNILILWQVLWDQTTRDEYPRFALHWEETTVMTPAAPWESHSAMAHRKEKAGFPWIQDFLLPPSLSQVLHHILPHSWHANTKKQHGNIRWIASVPVPTRGLVQAVLSPVREVALLLPHSATAAAWHWPAKLPTGLGSPGMD